MSRLSSIYEFFNFLQNHGIKIDKTDFDSFHREEILDISDNQYSSLSSKITTCKKNV
jgi:hypothetical protein